MAYTLEQSPLPLEFTTSTEPYIELTLWGEIKQWLSSERNVALYILLPCLGAMYGGCVFLYIIHRLRRMYKRAKRRRRAEMREYDKQQLLADEDESSHVTRISGPLTYHDNGSSTLNERSLYPNTNRATLHPPRPQMSNGPIKKKTTISAKPRTQIIVRCRCEGAMHNPGCPKFGVPDLKMPNRAATYNSSMTACASDVNVTLQDAMDKVAAYENELKNNPSMQALLQRYREVKREKTKRKWEENVEKGDWQKVPIAQLLERKKKMKEDGRLSATRPTVWR